MVVYHFTAPDLIVLRDWQPIATFPRDGRTVEVRDAMGLVSKATWSDAVSQIVTAGDSAGVSVEWRTLD